MKPTASVCDRGTITGCSDDCPQDRRVFPIARPSASRRSSSPNLPSSSWYTGKPTPPSEERSGAPFTSVLILKNGDAIRRRGGLQVSPSSSETIRFTALPAQPPTDTLTKYRHRRPFESRPTTGLPNLRRLRWRCLDRKSVE